MSNPGAIAAASTRAEPVAVDTPIEQERAAPRPVRCAVRGVHKAFGQNQILRGVDVTIDEGAFAVLVGPSGCGKSTLLRLVAGLETADAGTIELAGKDVTSLPPRDRDIAMVFQSYALYPHLSVRENLSFGLKLRKVPADEIDKRIKEASQMLGPRKVRVHEQHRPAARRMRWRNRPPIRTILRAEICRIEIARLG